MDEVKAALESIKNNHRTPDQLRQMKLSELISRNSVFAVELSTFASQQKDMEEAREEDPGLYAIGLEMVEAHTRNLSDVNSEIDRRFPGATGKVTTG